MAKYGIVTHSKYFNFVNYGSMLQCYALQKTLDKMGVDNTIIDYRNDALLTKDIYHPLKNMKDNRFVSRLGCFLSYPDIKKANRKFEKFWDENYNKTEKKYTSSNFNELQFDGYICGSDTIWDIDESAGFDKGFFADFECMKGKNNISYSPSVGDRPFIEDDRKELTEMLKNFTHISMRETNNSGIADSCTDKTIFKTIDPTLLLDSDEYESIVKEPSVKKPYILIYSREYNKNMTKFADSLAKKYNLDVIEISLRKQNFYKHKMAYNTGIDEFLGLIKNAEFVITNSYHGAIFSIQFRRELYVFSRDCCSNKINVMLEMAGLSERLTKSAVIPELRKTDYDAVWRRIKAEREKSFDYLKNALSVADK